MKILEEVKNILKQKPMIKLAIVYGSFAQGKEKPDSDLDLAVAGDRVLTPDEKVDIVNLISSKIGREVDLIDLNEATGTVVKQAVETGVVLIKHDVDLLARILSRIVTDEEDFQKTRRKLMKSRRKKAFDVA